MRSTGAIRSTLIGYGVVAFAFFPPTRALLLCGVAVQIATIVARKLIERQIGDPPLAAQASTIVELFADGATVALFAIATFGGIMQSASQM